MSFFVCLTLGTLCGILLLLRTWFAGCKFSLAVAVNDMKRWHELILSGISVEPGGIFAKFDTLTLTLRIRRGFLKSSPEISGIMTDQICWQSKSEIHCRYQWPTFRRASRSEMITGHSRKPFRMDGGCDTISIAMLFVTASESKNSGGKLGQIICEIGNYWGSMLEFQFFGWYCRNLPGTHINQSKDNQRNMLSADLWSIVHHNYMNLK
jgi:hypothetical protein